MKNTQELTQIQELFNEAQEHLNETQEQLKYLFMLIEHSKNNYIISSKPKEVNKKKKTITKFSVNDKLYDKKFMSDNYKDFIFDLCKNPFITREFLINHLGKGNNKGSYRTENTFGSTHQKEVSELPSIGGFISTKSETRVKVSNIQSVCDSLKLDLKFIYE